MPYKSDAQRRLFHAKEERGEISPAVVHEFDQASKGMKLPEHVRGGSMHSGHSRVAEARARASISKSKRRFKSPRKAIQAQRAGAVGRGVSNATDMRTTSNEGVI